MTEHRLANILRAIADGKVVQVRAKHWSETYQKITQGDWKDLPVHGNFSLFQENPSIEYRIKPKSLVKKWRWVTIGQSAGQLIVTGGLYSEKERLATFVEKVESTMIEVEEDDE